MAAMGKSRTGETLIIIFQYIIAAVIILNGATMWTSISDGGGTAFSNVLLCILIASCSVCILTRSFMGMTWRDLAREMIALGFLLFLIVFILINTYNLNLFFRMALAFLSLGLYYFTCEAGNEISGLLMAYRNIAVVIAAVSVIMWVLCSILKIIPASGLVYSDWSDAGTNEGINCFYGIYFEPQTITLFGRDIIRNCSIFTEAPMASYCFSVAVLIELFLTDKLSVIKVIILAAAICTTFSTTGMVIVLVGIVLYLIINKIYPRWIRSDKKTTKRIILILTIIFIAALCAVGFYLVKSKLVSDSGSQRLDDYRAGFLSWCDNIWFGNGLDSAWAIQQYMGQWRAPRFGFSNSVMQVLANGGIMLGALFFLPYIRCAVHDIRKKKIDHLVFTVCILGMFLITIYTYRYLTYFLIYYFAFYGLKLIKRSNCRNLKA